MAGSEIEMFNIWFRHTGTELPGNLDTNETRVYTKSEILTEVGDNTITHLTMRGDLTPSLVELTPHVTNVCMHESVEGLEPIDQWTTLKKLDISYNKLMMENINLPASLSDLDMSWCDISALPKCISSLANLKKLSVSGNPLLKIGELPASLEELNISDCDMSTLPPSISQLTNLKKLDVSRNYSLGEINDLPASLEELNMPWAAISMLPRSLSQLTNLKKLDISRCKSLSEFDDLPISLEELNLSFSDLVSVPERITELTNLTKLDISYNRTLNEINDLPISLEKLYISHCNISTLPQSLSQLTNLWKMNISRNASLEDLSGLPTSLKVLYMGSCSTNRRPGIQISHLTNLRKLSISNNIKEIGDLPASIEELTMSRCELSAIPPSVSQMKNLTSLDVSYNDELREIGNLPTSLEEFTMSACGVSALPQSMSQLTKLKKLYLYGDELLSDISSLPTSLEEIYMSNCDISTLPQSMSQMEKLWFLHMSGNKVTEKEISYLPTSITELHIADCQISSIPQCMSQLTNLKKLDISSNSSLKEISNLPSSLERLDILGCGISSLPPSMSLLTNLRKLDMSSNEMLKEVDHLPASLEKFTLIYSSICTIPQSFAKLCKLRVLDLSMNGSLREVKDLPRSLQHLYLDSCNLSVLPQCMPQLTNLKELNIGNNEFLKEIGDLPTSLEVLNMCQCNLSTIPQSIAKLQRLSNLNISNNKFAQLPSYITKLQNLVSLDVSYNIDDSPQLTSLTEGILDMPLLTNITVFGCDSLTSPPYEVCGEGVQAIKTYYRDMAASSKVNLPIVTVAVIGQSMAGKTSLIKTLQNPDNKRELTGRGAEAVSDQTTKVFDMKEVKFGGMALQFIDFGGQEIYQLAYRMTLKRNCLPIVVVSLKMYKERMDEVGENEAVHHLFFDWLSHLYLAYPDLAAPKLVLTHKDVFEAEERKQMRSSFLQSCGRVLQNELEDGATHWPFRNLQRNVLFREEDIYEIGNDPEEWIEFNRLKEVLFEQSKKFADEVPKTWQEVEEKLKSYTGTYTSLEELENDLTGDLAAIKGHLDVILTYLYNTGKVLRFANGLVKNLIFYKIRAVTEIVYALYSHDGGNSSYPSVLLDRQSDYFMTPRGYEEHNHSFHETGTMSPRLLYFLLSAKTKFNNNAGLGVAVELLKSFQLLDGPLRLKGEPSYVLPYFCTGYVTDRKFTSASPDISLVVELEFMGLSLPRYAFYQMSTELLKLFPSGREIEVKQNGVSIEVGNCCITMLHNFKARKTSIHVSTRAATICQGWLHLREITSTIVKMIKRMWTASQIVCTVFCPHCLLKRDPHPRRVIDPDWCYTPEGVLLPGEEDPVGTVPQPPDTKCKEDRDVPRFLMGFCDYLSAVQLDRLDEYVENAAIVTVNRLEGLRVENEQEPVETQGGSDSEIEDDETESSISDDKDSTPLLELRSTRKKDIKSLFHNVDKVYKMSTPTRGKALVINNYPFSGRKRDQDGQTVREPSHESEVGVGNVTRMLRLLNFQVLSLQDLTAQEMICEVQKETRDPDHADYGMFMLILMTHGSGDDVIYGSDNKPVKLSDLYELMTSKRFPGMRGKPKAVIVQSCRKDALPQESDEGRPNVRISVDDLLVLHSHSENPSQRDTRCESSFIRILVSTILKHSYHRDLWSLFHIVQKKMRQRTEKLSKDNSQSTVQIPFIFKTLTRLRKVYLFPLYNGE